jgi:hypothetical protein
VAAAGNCHRKRRVGCMATETSGENPLSAAVTVGPDWPSGNDGLRSHEPTPQTALSPALGDEANSVGTLRRRWSV